VGYTNDFGPRVAFANVSGLQVEQVFFTNAPFELSPPPSVDWADYKEQEEGPPIRTPRPAWDWYREQYPNLAAEPPTPEQVAAWAPPTPDPPPPVTDVERLAQGVTLYRAANEAAKEIILTLMVKVSGAMINLEVVNAASEPITADNVNDEGARFVAYHREAIVDYKQAGRNQVAANALYAAVSSEGSLTAFPWLEASGGIILGIFASELGVTP